MSHYVIITENEPTVGNAGGGRNLGLTGYRASCKCGWLEKAQYPAEIAARTKDHLERSDAETFAYDWRSHTPQPNS